MADEIVVDFRGSGDAATIQAGVDLASKDDVVIVYPGQYPESVTVTRGLRIIAQQSSTVEILGPVSVLDIPRTSQVVLSGLDIDLSQQLTMPGAASPDGALIVSDSEGLVTLHDCRLTGNPFVSSPTTLAPGAFLVNARRVVVTDSSIRGADGVSSDPMGLSPIGGDSASTGLVMTNSRATMWGGSIAGGEGVERTFSAISRAGDGGHGAVLRQSQLYVNGVMIRGGDGGRDRDFIPAPGGDGGDGVRTDAGSEILLQQSTVAAGIGGRSATGVPGVTGAPLAGQGSAQFLPGQSQAHVSESWAFAQSTLDMTLRGTPGDAVEVFLATGLPPFLFDLAGSMPSFTPRIDSGSALGVAGVIGGNGELAISVNIPALPTSPSTFPVVFLARTATGASPWIYGAPMPVIGVNCSTSEPDCNGNGVGDLCEIVRRTASDIDRNGIPDDCDPDCNANGVLDVLDIELGISTDLNGNWIPDECESSMVSWIVDPNAAAGGNGSAIAPFRSIGEAARVCLSGDEIVLRDGVYNTADDRKLDFGPRSVSIRSENGPAQCIIDAQSLGRVFTFSSIGFAAPAEVSISGLTILNGRVTGVPVFSGEDSGGAILAIWTELTVSDCTFEGCVAAGGGALFAHEGRLTVRSSTFRGNTDTLGNVWRGGGAISARLMLQGVTLDDCLFVDNASPASGGAVRVQQAGPLFVSRCRFFRNASPGFIGEGGALFLRNVSDWHFDQSLFAGNQADKGGAVLVQNHATFSGLVTHCTMHGNVANEGSAIRLYGGGAFAIYNSIIWSNGDPNLRPIDLSSSAAANVDVQSSNLEGGVGSIAWTGTTMHSVTSLNVINVDPAFRDLLGPDGDPSTVEDNDYRLMAGSPSVDAGANPLLAFDNADTNGNGVTNERVTLDLDGRARRNDDPATANTGVGLAPLTDQGAYER